MTKKKRSFDGSSLLLINLKLKKDWKDSSLFVYRLHSPSHLLTHLPD